MLTAEQRAVLDFEGAGWFKYAGAKETAIRDTLGISATRYAQILVALTDRDDAMAYAPLLIGRLRRLRDARRAARSPQRRSA